MPTDAITIPSSDVWESNETDQYQIEIDGGQFITLTASFSGHYSERGTSLVVQGIRHGFFGTAEQSFTWNSDEFTVMSCYRSNFRKHDAIIFVGLAANEITGDTRTELLLKLITTHLEANQQAQDVLAHWAAVQPTIG